MTETRGITIVLSGGLDSTVLLAMAVEHGFRARTLTFDYGQHHAREIASAKRVAQYYDVVNDVVAVDLASLGMQSALLTKDVALPLDMASDDVRQRATIVPNRNLIMLSIAVAQASTYGHHFVWFGAHAGDRAVYPDCRPEFIEALNVTLRKAYGGQHPLVIAPFIDLSKGAIVRRGIELDAPLQYTWTCYAGGDEPCKRCGSCVERAEAFSANNAIDPFRREWW